MHGPIRSLLPFAAAAAAGALLLATAPAGAAWGSWGALALPVSVGTALLLRLHRDAHAHGAALARDRRRVDEILRRIPALVSVQDPEGEFVSVNPALVAHYGAAHASQIVGNQPRATSLHAVDTAFLQVLETEVPVDLVHESTARDGTVSTFNSSLVPFRLDDGRPGILHVATDITEMRALYRSLSDALARALSDFIPICAGCRQVRLDPEAGGGSDAREPEWSPLERYVADRTAARFSHTFCPDCAMRLYGEHLFEDGGEGDAAGSSTDPRENAP